MIDTHCHLEMCAGEDPAEQGLDRIATVGIDGDAVAAALRLADEHAQVHAIVGRHPNSATGFAPADAESIARAAQHPKVVAIGETGLDYYRDHAPRSDQQRAFEAQIELASELGLPLVIHVREAEADVLATLAAAAPPVPVVMHCFSAVHHLAECIERGYLCSFAGNVTFPKATDLQDAAARVPDALLLVETDSPFLAPQPVRGKPNAPRNVVHTARRLAELRGTSYEALERLVTANAARVFGW